MGPCPCLMPTLNRSVPGLVPNRPDYQVTLVRPVPVFGLRATLIRGFVARPPERREKTHFVWPTLIAGDVKCSRRGRVLPASAARFAVRHHRLVTIARQAGR